MRCTVGTQRKRTRLAHVALAGILLSLASFVLADVEHEVGRINLEVARLIEKGWFDVATELAEKAVELGEAELSEDHPLFVQALQDLAGLRQRMGDDAGARSLYERVLKIQEQSLGPDHPDLARCLDDLAGVHRATHSFDEAESLYLRALSLRESAYGSEDPRLVESLNNLAGLYQIRGEHAQARAPLERVIAIQEKTLGPEHPELVSPLKFKASICHAQEDRACAKAMLERALEIEGTSARRLPPSEPGRGAIGITLWATPSGAAGGKGRMYAAKVFFIRLGDDAEPFSAGGRVWPNYSWSEQELFARRAADLIESTTSEKGDVYLLNAEPGRYLAVGAVLIYEGPGQTIGYHGYLSTEVVAQSEVTVAPGQMVYMGNVRAAVRGAPDPTQRYFFDSVPPQEAPVIDIRGFGAVNYRDAPQWVKLDQIERGGKSETAFWNRTRRAFKYETTWLGSIPEGKVAEDVAPPEEAKYVQRSQRALDDLSSGEFKGAKAAAERALGICRSHPDADRACLAPALGNLADVLTGKNERLEAAPLYRQALELRERTLGAEHPAVACTLGALARLSRLDAEHEEAERLAARALALFEAALGQDHPAVADALALMAEIHESKGDHEQATAMIERALRIREDALGWTHPSVVPLLNFLAEQSSRRADHGRTAELAKRVLAIHERILGVDHRRVGDSLFTLALARHASGQYPEAAALLERALAIQTDAYGSKHQRVIDTTISLAAAYDQQGEAAKATRLRTQADELSQQKAVDDLHALGGALVRYAMDNGKYPTTTDIEVLKQLLHPSYIYSMSTEDGWGNPYQVASGTSRYELKSLGKDGVAQETVGGSTSTFGADIVFANGAFSQWPEGPQE